MTRPGARMVPRIAESGDRSTFRAARETAYYERLFRQLNVEPSLLTAEEISQIPLTPKIAPRTAPDDFVRKTARTVFRATTTGTTGRPTCITFSQNELKTLVGLSAIGHLIALALLLATPLH